MGEGREKRRERNIDVREKHWSVASHVLSCQDWTHNLGTGPDWESNQRPFTSQGDSPPAEPRWSGWTALFVSSRIVLFHRIASSRVQQLHVQLNKKLFFQSNQPQVKGTVTTCASGYLIAQGRQNIPIIRETSVGQSCPGSFLCSVLSCIWLALWTKVSFITGRWDNILASRVS